jgi:hypothetical protein
VALLPARIASFTHECGMHVLTAGWPVCTVALALTVKQWAMNVNKGVPREGGGCQAATLLQTPKTETS